MISFIILLITNALMLVVIWTGVSSFAIFNLARTVSINEPTSCPCILLSKVAIALASVNYYSSLFFFHIALWNSVHIRGSLIIEFKT